MSVHEVRHTRSVYLPASWNANRIAARARSVHCPSDPKKDEVRSDDMLVQIAGHPPEPPSLRMRSVLGIALFKEDASKEENEEAASGNENASTKARLLTSSREARFWIMLPLPVWRR